MAFVFPTTSYTVDMGAARRVISSVKPLAAASNRIIGMSGIKCRNVSEVVESGSMNMKNWAKITISVKTNPNLHSGLDDSGQAILQAQSLRLCCPLPGRTAADVS